MRLREEFRAARENFGLLTLYQKFEQAVVLVLTGLIVVFIVFAIWNLALKIFQSIAASTFDPTDYSVFQAVFGMIFTVIIALEFKWSILVVSERRHSVVQVRAVILIALLAIVRKLIILDVAHSAPIELFALAAAIVALGAVYWLVRDQDRIEREDRASAAATTGGGRDDKERGARNRRSPRARRTASAPPTRRAARSRG